MDMDCKIIEEEDNRIRILLTGTDHASVNALRRTMIADTPKMAIHQVRFTQSTEITDDGTVWETVGPIPDEVIAHRLAMTPIPSDTQDFSFEHECINCKDMVESQRGCPLCNIVYTCNVKGLRKVLQSRQEISRFLAISHSPFQRNLLTLLSLSCTWGR